ncbi:MAG TPA: PPOX class F420-dependent oxidoreductase [Candidatus Limnocylindrales bacterium]|nr:PPOX class F420-dependent oxidoreductase [Candidatus Limnocylindrales bacterium]
MQDTQMALFPALAGHDYMSLTTFRKNGDAVPTPVWFAQVGGRLYVMTNTDSGKVKRIRNNGRVELAPCTNSGKVLGDSAAGMARVLTPEEETQAREALAKKYGFKKRMFDLMIAVRRSPTVHLEITPL